MLRTSFALIALCAIATAANAAPLLPYEGESIDLGSLRGVAYYSEHPDGFRVVATLAEGEAGLPVRFEATLADHQKLTISVPRGAGEAPRLVEFSRTGDSLVVDHDEAAKPPCLTNQKCPNDS